MPAKSETRRREASAVEAAPQFRHWEGAQVLLAVMRNGSLRRAAEAMSISVVVARRRIEDFEREIGARLFVRDRRGTRLTSEGESIFAAVERMEAASLDVVRTQESFMQSLSGAVRIRVPDGLGSFWLTPRLGDFQRAFPKILIDLDCALASDAALKESDIVLTLGRPVRGAKQRRLGRVHFLPYASARYIENFGAPASAEEAVNHRWLVHADPNGGPKDLLKEWFADAQSDNPPVMKNSAISAHYWAVAQGIGLGALPTYLSALGSKLQPLDIGLKQASDLWLSYHAESKPFSRVNRMVDWLSDAFNPRKFPWFRDEFIRPDELMGRYEGAPLVKLFDC